MCAAVPCLQLLQHAQIAEMAARQALGLLQLSYAADPVEAPGAEEAEDDLGDVSDGETEVRRIGQLLA